MENITEEIDNTTEQINTALKEHQTHTKDWEKHELIRDLHVWGERFILEFKLKVPQPAIRIDPISNRCYGHHRRGRNGFGLRDEVAINETYIDPSRYWRCLQTLLHELLHVEQENTGSPGEGNYHNKELRERASGLGLVMDNWGHTHLAATPNPFTNILNKYGLQAPDIKKTEIPLQKQKGNSKLKLWICECQPKPVRVRVAIEDFQARCLKCGFLFQKQD